MNRRTLIKSGLTLMSSAYLSRVYSRHLPAPYAAGPRFEPTWSSLSQYQVPDWYRDAKFGIWAHWGPQCQPEYGDWYARGMYEEGSEQYKYHCKKYGHPSKFGFKDVINEWKADQWNPQELVSLYKAAGAKYFVALANHHDNFDLYPNKYQPWNSTRIGPMKDIMRGWADAAKANGLPFGVSVHASHAWSWYEVSQGADKKGPYAGVPYDGNITAAQGKGKWWDGYDPQQLYSQQHPLSQTGRDGNKQWDWGDGAYPPSKQYCEKFYNRIIKLIDSYDPQLIYFDDTALPLWPVSDVGLKIAAYLYNRSAKMHGKVNAVINGKILTEEQRKCMVWDIERGHSNQIEPLPWQTDTCLGNWHYDIRVYNDNKYKSGRTIIQTLADVVSKNGNLLLSVPVKGNGTIDDKEKAVVKDITEWMRINSEAIYSTRPWRVHGEGPALESTTPLTAQGYNEGKGKSLGAADIRFTTKPGILYATFMGWPDDHKLTIKSLKENLKVEKVSLLGHHEPLRYTHGSNGFEVALPEQAPGKDAFVLKLEGFAG